MDVGELNLEDFGLWLIRCQKQYEQIYIDNFVNYKSGFKMLSKEYNDIIKEKELTNEFEAWDFSIFNVLSFLRPEENLHSPLLAELLDTNGSHGQKDLFYKLFLYEVMGKEKARKFINRNYQEYSIKKEEYIDNITDTGRIDIAIKSTNRHNKFAIILENKWNNGDSCDQLFKYYRNFTNPNGQGYTDDNLIIIYLTKCGKMPENVVSKKFEAFLSMNIEVNFFPLSYIYNVRSWLEKCAQECKSEKVNYIIKQYLTFIKYEISYR